MHYIDKERPYLFIPWEDEQVRAKLRSALKPATFFRVEYIQRLLQEAGISPSISYKRDTELIAGREGSFANRWYPIGIDFVGVVGDKVLEDRFIEGSTFYTSANSRPRY